MKIQNWMVFLVLVLLPQLVWSGGSSEQGESKESPARVIEAEMSYLEGDVQVNDEEAEPGQFIPLGSRVKTGPASYCEITFGSKNIFRVEENTLTTISIGEEKKIIDIERGSIDAVFNRLENLAGIPEFSITTPSMIAGVRGTVFYLKVEDPRNTYLCTCNGTILQRGADQAPEQNLEVTATHHKAYRYTKTSEGTKIESAGMLYHTDETMDSVAEKIDVKIPWGKGKTYE